MQEDVTINSKLTVEHVLPQAWIEHWRLPDGQKGLTREERVQTPAQSRTGATGYSKRLET